MLAREIETGTFRYAWTQGFGRRRWTVAKLVLVGVAVAAIAGAFSVLVSWYYQPYLASGNGAVFSSPSPLSPGLFDLRGVAFAAWTLAAFAIGALAGMLIRRIVPAIVATLAAYAGLALLAGNVLRQHYLTPLVAKGSNLPGAAWVTSEWWTKGGKVAFSGRPPVTLLQQLCPSNFVPGPGGGIGVRGAFSPTTCLVQHGYTQWSDYQPASHYWPFQWIEGGWLLALSVLLIRRDRLAGPPSGGLKRAAWASPLFCTGTSKGLHRVDATGSVRTEYGKRRIRCAYSQLSGPSVLATPRRRTGLRSPHSRRCQPLKAATTIPALRARPRLGCGAPKVTK